MDKMKVLLFLKPDDKFLCSLNYSKTIVLLSLGSLNAFHG